MKITVDTYDTFTDSFEVTARDERDMSHALRVVILSETEATIDAETSAATSDAIDTDAFVASLHDDLDAFNAITDACVAFFVKYIS